MCNLFVTACSWGSFHTKRWCFYILCFKLLSFSAFTQDFQEEAHFYIGKSNSITGWPLCNGQTRNCETPTSDKNFKMADNEEDCSGKIYGWYDPGIEGGVGNCDTL